MKIVVAPDSFKGSLSAIELCDYMEAGLLRVDPTIQVVKLPMADGGEGTVAALVAATTGRLQTIPVMGPLGETVQAEYGILGDGRTAVIEMAAASGLPLVPPEKRNPLKTTSFGTGQLICAALEQGCRKLIIGIGGSATTDCGAGMAQALGIRFLRADGRPIVEPMCGETMDLVAGLDFNHAHPALMQADIVVACDVDNPLLGPRGAVMVYSPQKGATVEQLPVLERKMGALINVIERAIGQTVRDVPGAGAAGGLGAGMLAFARAHLRPGVNLVMEACDFAGKIHGARMILTGEGRVDRQTAFGKTISGIAREAQKQGIPVIVLAGSIEPEADNLYEMGVSALFSICSGPLALQEAMENAGPLMARAVENVLRLVSAT